MYNKPKVMDIYINRITTLGTVETLKFDVKRLGSAEKLE